MSWTLISKVSDSTPPRTQLRVGRLTKAHGLKGAIKLELFTDDPGRRFVPGAVFTLQVPSGSPWHGKTLELVELRWYNQHAVGFFKDVPDREAAETLAKAILWIDQDSAEQSDEEDAWYDHQLVGLAVVRDGVKVGTIARLDHMPAQDLLIVRTPDGEVMVPFVKAIVPSVDVKAGIVTITPPPGLFEELPESEEAEPAADEGSEAAPGTDAAASADDEAPTVD
jgi:16S rRNA processing protein RimM